MSHKFGDTYDPSVGTVDYDDDYYEYEDDDYANCDCPVCNPSEDEHIEDGYDEFD